MWPGIKVWMVLALTLVGVGVTVTEAFTANPISSLSSSTSPSSSSSSSSTTTSNTSPIRALLTCNSNRQRMALLAQTGTTVNGSAVPINGETVQGQQQSMNSNINIRLNVFEKARTVTSVCTSGTLCTISVHEGITGAPFGSFVDYVLDDEGNPVFLMNEMSMHTMNIRKAQEQQNGADPIVTLFTQLGGSTTTTTTTNLASDSVTTTTTTTSSGNNAGLQDVSRCSLTGRLVKLDSTAADMDTLRMRYSLKHVYADQVMDSPKFAFYRLVPSHIYFVGGFGVLSTWVDPRDYRTANPDILATEATEICARINREYVDDLLRTAQHLLNIAPDNPDGIEQVRLTNVDRLGMDIRVTARTGTRRNKLQTDEFRIGFRIPVISVEDAKSEILKIFQEAWEKANGVTWGEESELPGESVPILKIAADSLE